MKVLLALDGSAPSVVARDLVTDLSWPAGTALHLLAAYQLPVDWTAGMGSTSEWIGGTESAMRVQLEDELRALADPLVRHGLDVKRHVVRGRAADTITDLAAEIGADLIVTGSRAVVGNCVRCSWDRSPTRSRGTRRVRCSWHADQACPAFSWQPTAQPVPRSSRSSWSGGGPSGTAWPML